MRSMQEYFRLQRMWQFDLRVRTHRRKSDGGPRIWNLALCKRVPSSEPAPCDVSQCEIRLRPILEERLHLAEHLLGAILHKLIPVGLGGKCRYGCYVHSVGQ